MNMVTKYRSIAVRTTRLSFGCLLWGIIGWAQSSILLQHANLIDGVSDQAIRDTTVLIQQGRIVSVGGIEHPPANTVVVDLAGRWVMPGLIDAHVHLFDLKSARALVAVGVTTVRTMHVDHF